MIVSGQVESADAQRSHARPLTHIPESEKSDWDSVFRDVCLARLLA